MTSPPSSNVSSGTKTTPTTDVHHLVNVPAGDQPELIADALWAAGAIGVEEIADIVRGAFADRDLARSAARSLDGHLEPAADQTGLDAWSDHADVHRAGPFLVRPPWLPAEAGTIDLVLDPGHAFGSGSHPSTRLALELIASNVAPNDRVLDVGTGSGVLAIGAALMGATVHAIDTDHAAAAAVHANAAANAVTSQISFEAADARSVTGAFDLVVCNMTIDLHELVGGPLSGNASAPRLVVAGILAGPQEDRVCAAHARADVLVRRAEGEWAALLLG